MLPFVLVSQLQRGAEDYLRSTLPSNPAPFHGMLNRFFNRVKFPVLHKHGQNTWYDRNGRIIYTQNRGLTGVGFKTKRWREVKEMEGCTVEHVTQDDTQPRQPSGPVERTIVYEAPFDACDREADYAEAWAAFEARGM